MPSNSALREAISSGRLIAAPGVFDLVSAKLADSVGFDALYMTGFGVVASHLGFPDAGLATYTEMVSRVEAITGGVNTPLIADADTGFGGLLNVERTVLGYERAGAAAIQIEDQEFPKKCGHTPGRKVVPLADMVAKVKVAATTRASPDFLVIARTDARTELGLDEALRRAEAFARAGADVLFVEALESEEEMARVGRAVGLPLVVNLVEGGRTPILPADRLEELGFRLAILPLTGLLAAAATLRRVYETLRTDRSSAALREELYPFSEFTRLMGFEKVWDFDRRWAAGREDDGGRPGP